WRYLALLLVLGTLFVLLYVYSISDTVLAARQLRRFNFVNFLQIIPITIGMPFSRYNLLTAIVLCVVGIIGYLINAFYLFRLGELKKLLIPTSLVIFSFFAITITSVGRTRNLNVGFYQWYSPQTILFWLALFLLMLVVFNIYRTKKSTRIDHAIALLNVGLLVLAAYFYLQTYRTAYNNNFSRDFVDLHNCARSYPFTLDAGCLDVPENYGFERYPKMQEIITNRLLLFNDPALYPIPDVYEVSSVLWVNVSDPQKVVLIRSAVLPQLLDEYKVTEQAELSAFISQIEATEQIWVIQEEGAPLPSFEMENAPEIIYQERILPDIPYQLIGYALD
ncbi:MAG: hypothetical protein MUF38_11290, partial [Anaerolineae bacterium]|nr:hypothetical protein [Anaerolineae bacterium]